MWKLQTLASKMLSIGNSRVINKAIGHDIDSIALINKDSQT
jgi:hypothetical protein